MEPQVLDLIQLARIQGTHRGFLYQHLYAAGCMLMAPSTGVVSVRIERDEDVELVCQGHVVYAQVKTRGAPLAPSDVEGMLERFDTIRAAHARGARDGVARFALVTNVALGPTLNRRAWPSDVLVVTPATPPHVIQGTGLVASQANVAELLAQVQQFAEGYRLSALRPDSLVAKLVGVVAHAAAGERTKPSFATSELGLLCELIGAQVRPLPRVPRYLPQVDEPTLPEGRGSLVVLGHAGYGKSAWAAEVAAHTSDVAVYLACSSAPGEQVTARLVDATISTLVARGNAKAFELVLPGRTGAEALALLEQKLASRGIQVTVVLDDCHHSTSAILLEMMRVARSVRWILLGRPCDALSETASLMSIPQVVLNGWGDDAIASLLYDAHCSTGPADVAALRNATSGAPLFVVHSIRAISEGAIDTGEYARALVAGTTAGRTPQDILLEGAVVALDPQIARVASTLAAIDISLRGEEWVELIKKSVGDDSSVVRRSLRALVDRQIAHETQQGVVSVHDAFRPILVCRFLSNAENRLVKESAAELLRADLLNERASERVLAYVRILASLGRLSELADMANALSEWFRETGTISEVRGHLEISLTDSSLTPADRFWALDTLAFLDVENERCEEAAGRLPEMAHLAIGLDDHARGAVQHKRALISFCRGDIDEMRRLASAPMSSPSYGRILRYHVALAEARAGHVVLALRQLRDLAAEYLTEIGLTASVVFAKNPDELRPLIRSDADSADILHLADCYDAIVRISATHLEHREQRVLYSLWSTKFYALAGAIRSLLRAGQEVVETILGDLGDPFAARDFIERAVLPTMQHARLPEMTIPIRAQYAVVCAHCGDHVRAGEVMEALAPYAGGLTSEGRAELENQRQLVAQLRMRGAPSAQELEARMRRIDAQKEHAERLRTALVLGPPPQVPFRPPGKVGRNEQCPCGSSRKFKKCCGA